jgi:hypothetical protein
MTKYSFGWAGANPLKVGEEEEEEEEEDDFLFFDFAAFFINLLSTISASKLFLSSSESTASMVLFCDLRTFLLRDIILF